MAKFFGVVLTITRTFIVASALAMAVALPMWSSLALAQNDVRTSSEGGDTFVKRTYDDKTGKLLKVVRDTETRDPNDRTKILKKVTTKRYDQGKRPHYETTVDEQEIAVDGRKRVVRKRTKTSTTYTKTKNRNLVINVKEEKELVGLNANGVPIYTGTRVTTRGKGFTPEKNEVWDVRTRKWVRIRSGLKQLLEAQRKQLLEAQRQKRLNLTKTAREKLKEEAALKDKRMRKEDIKKDKVKKEETNKARRQGRGTGRTSAKQDPLARVCPGGEWRSGTLAKIRQIATGWKKELSSGCAGTSLCRTHRGGSSFQAYMKTLIIWQCHATFVRLSKKGSDEDKKLAREEGCAIEQTLDEMAEQIKATGFMTAGASWKPFHIDMSEKWKLKDLCDTKNIEEASSGSGNEPKIVVPPVAEAKPKKDCKAGGLVGAMNCVTKRIEGAGGSGARTAGKPPDSARSTDKNTGVTTTSVKNPDGTRTVTRTDRNGNVLSKKTVSKSPASASSTDRKTGVTTKSVRNPDGTRTVTKTDKDGNVLSRETVGNSPDSASSTGLKTKVTIKSVANPDGSRTVTTTGKDGIVLSREKVR